MSRLFTSKSFSPCACNDEGPCQYHGDEQLVVEMLSVLRKIVVRVERGLPVKFDTETQEWLVEITGYAGEDDDLGGSKPSDPDDGLDE